MFAYKAAFLTYHVNKSKAIFSSIYSLGFTIFVPYLLLRCHSAPQAAPLRFLPRPLTMRCIFFGRALLFSYFLFLFPSIVYSFHHLPSPSDEPRSGGLCPFSRLQKVARCSCYVAGRDGLLNLGLRNLCIATVDAPVSQFFSACRLIGVVQKRCVKSQFPQPSKRRFSHFQSVGIKTGFRNDIFRRPRPFCTPDVDELQLISLINSTLAACPLSSIIAENRMIVTHSAQSRSNSPEAEVSASRDVENFGKRLIDRNEEAREFRPALPYVVEGKMLYLGEVVSRACNVKKKTATIWLLTQLGRVLVRRYRPAAFRSLPDNYLQVTYGVRCFVNRMVRLVQLTPRALRLLLYNGMIGNETEVVRNRSEGNGISACKAALRNGQRRISCVCRRVRK